MMARRTLLFIFLFIGLCSVAVRAQAPATSVAAAPVSAPAAPALVGGLTPEELAAPFRGSFFLSPVEISVIQQATEGKISDAATLRAASQALPTRRIISVAGVVYKSSDNWIVWVNGQKVLPGKLLPEIIDISVKDSSKVNLKWYDQVLNKVIAITLRPHQTYDIPTGILLPGGP